MKAQLLKRLDQIGQIEPPRAAPAGATPVGATPVGEAAGRAGAPRLGWPGLAAVSAATLAYAAYPSAAEDRAIGLACFGVALASLLAVARAPDRAVLLAPLLAALTLAPAAVGLAVPWPLSLAAPLVVLALLARAVPALRSSMPPLRRGAFGPAVVGWIAAVVLVSALALVLWVRLMRPDLSQMRALLPPVSLPLLLLGGLGFALFNALLEEAVFRLVFLGSLDAVTTSGWTAVLVQAAAFGLLHLNGFPSGAVGVGLAAIYAVMLGVLRRRAGGLLAPYVAHVAADLTIFALLLTWTR
ncbi:CPBP family intramembrane glutamic endopeptidase [Sorangium sp. So ce764]|uniref:CPBP family intramembrane glutamic endopeptidase n=1 Tax=Sorangium sp. So ce764 TaxID=3133320 RepID=UPI003F5E0DA8